MKEELKKEMLEGIKDVIVSGFINEENPDDISFKTFTVAWSISEKHIQIANNKLTALLEGLETQHIDKFIAECNVDDCRNYGKVYYNAVKQKVNVKEIEIAKIQGAINELRQFAIEEYGGTFDNSWFMAVDKKINALEQKLKQLNN